MIQCRQCEARRAAIKRRLALWASLLNRNKGNETMAKLFAEAGAGNDWRVVDAAGHPVATGFDNRGEAEDYIAQRVKAETQVTANRRDAEAERMAQHKATNRTKFKKRY